MFGPPSTGRLYSRPPWHSNFKALISLPLEKLQRKDDVTQKYLRRFTKSEGALYVGKAQEKARVMHTERGRSRAKGGTYPWVVVQAVQSGVVEKQPWYEPSEKLSAEPIINSSMPEEFDTGRGVE